MKELIKHWPDPLTVPEEMERIKKEYEKQGYIVNQVSVSIIQLVLADGTVDIFWQDGAIWQEIIPTK